MGGTLTTSVHLGLPAMMSRLFTFIKHIIKQITKRLLGQVFPSEYRVSDQAYFERCSKLQKVWHPNRGMAFKIAYTKTRRLLYPWLVAAALGPKRRAYSPHD